MLSLGRACDDAAVEHSVYIRMSVANISLQFADLSDVSAAGTARLRHCVACVCATY